MTEPSSILVSELHKTSPLQEELHGLSAQTNQRGDVIVDPYFHMDPSYRTRCPHIPVVIKPTPAGDLLVYRIDNRVDFLTNLCLHQQLPEVCVAEEHRGLVQIAWPRNAGLNVVEYCDMQTDELVIQSFTRHSLNIHYKRYLPAEWDKDHVDVMIGNVWFLTEWSEHLPAYDLTVWQPWVYARHRASSFPMYRCKKSKICHQYKFRRSVASMLKMRIRESEDAEWIEIPFRKELVRCVDSNFHLPQPVIRATYSKGSDSEIEQRLETYTEYPMYVHQLLPVSKENPVEQGKSEDIQIKCSDPCVAIHILAENIDATKHNDLSNYTTSSNIEEGWNPIANYTLLNGNMERIPELPSCYGDRFTPLLYFNVKGNEVGYNSICFSHDAVDPIAINTTTILGDSTLKITVGDTNPFNNLKLSEDNSVKKSVAEIIRNTSISTAERKQYKIHVFLHVIKKILFKDGECTVSQ